MLGCLSFRHDRSHEYAIMDPSPHAIDSQANPHAYDTGSGQAASNCMCAMVTSRAAMSAAIPQKL